VISILLAVRPLGDAASNTFSRWSRLTPTTSRWSTSTSRTAGQALVKTIEYRADSPSQLEEFMFYDTLGARAVQAMMDWKAAHPKPDAGAAPTPQRRPRPALGRSAFPDEHRAAE